MAPYLVLSYWQIPFPGAWIFVKQGIQHLKHLLHDSILPQIISSL